jgi:hypothetical protein
MSFRQRISDALVDAQRVLRNEWLRRAAHRLHELLFPVQLDGGDWSEGTCHDETVTIYVA